MPNETFRTIIESIACTRSSPVSVFADFCKLSACAVSVLAREAEFADLARSYTAAEMSDFSRALALLVQEMEEKPFADLLGGYYLEIAAHSSKQARGEFFTPPELSKLIAGMLVDVGAIKAAGKPITVGEPACGSGGMVLALAELFAPDSVDLLRVTCQDINPVAADMCYINTTLWGIPAQVLLGNTLGSTLSAAWKNPHWRRVREDDRRLLTDLQRLLALPAPIEAPEENTAHPGTLATREINGQLELDLGGFRTGPSQPRRGRAD